VRPIHTARLDRARPVVVLTRELVRPHGLDHPCVVSCDNIVTVPAQEAALTAAIHAAFDLA